MSESPGPLIAIGGNEDREGERVVLREVARHLHGGTLLICAAASRTPADYVGMYREAFAPLGVEIDELDPGAETVARPEGAGGVFFTGGNQNRLVEALRGSPAERAVHAIWGAGGVIAGTSAGASVLAQTMLAHGPNDETPASGDIGFGEGLGFIADVIFDQHFAERGRVGRLVTAVSSRRELLGVGIDEDTAAVITGDRMRIVGAGGVLILDGSEGSTEDGLRLHLIGDGDAFDLAARRPV